MRIAMSTKSYLEDLPPDFQIPCERVPRSHYGEVMFRTKDDVYDDLNMSATLIDHDGEYYFWITMELGIIRPIIVDFIYEGICGVTSKLKKEHLYVGASHTHTAPLYARNPLLASHKPGYVETRETVFAEMLEHYGRIAAALFRACEAKLTEFHSDIKVTEIEGCYANRDDLKLPEGCFADPEGARRPCDKHVALIRFFSSGTDELIGMWLNMSCHSTIMLPHHKKLSSDLVGQVCKKLFQRFGVYPQPFCGCQGDVGPMTWVGETEQDNLDELERVSGSIVEQILSDPEQFRPVAIDRFEVEELSLGYRYQVAPDEIQKRLDRVLAIQASQPNAFERSRYDSNVKIHSARLGTTQFSGSLDGKAIHLGEIKLAVFNGELVSDLGAKLTRYRPHDYRLIVGYINDEAGYLVSTDDCWESMSRIIPLGLPAALVQLMSERLDSFDP